MTGLIKSDTQEKNKNLYIIILNGGIKNGKDFLCRGL